MLRATIIAVALLAASPVAADGHMPGPDCIEFTDSSGANVTETWCQAWATVSDPCGCSKFKAKRDFFDADLSLFGKAKDTLKKVMNPADTVGDWLDEKLDIGQ